MLTTEMKRRAKAKADAKRARALEEQRDYQPRPAQWSKFGSAMQERPLPAVQGGAVRARSAGVNPLALAKNDVAVAAHGMRTDEKMEHARSIQIRREIIERELERVLPAALSNKTILRELVAGPRPQGARPSPLSNFRRR